MLGLFSGALVSVSRALSFDSLLGPLEPSPFDFLFAQVLQLYLWGFPQGVHL